MDGDFCERTAALSLIRSARSVVLLLSVCGCSDRSQTAPDAGSVEWLVSTEATIEVGGRDDRAEYLLHNVVGATRLSDGRIVVANQGSSELKYFRPDGTHLRSAAGEGDGPGEVQHMLRLLRLAGDSLLLLSVRPGLTWYTPDGSYVRSTRVDLFGADVYPCRFGEGNNWPLADGSLLRLMEDNFAPSYCPPTPEGPWRMSGLIARPVLGTERFDTVALMPATERNHDNYRVHGRSLLLAFAADVVYAGDTGSDVILGLNLSGDTVAELPTPYPAVAVPRAARQESSRQWERPDGRIRTAGAYDFPEEYPRYGRLVVDNTGDLWVMAYPAVAEPLDSWRLEGTAGGYIEDGGARWRVLSRDGSVKAGVRTPPELFVLEIGDDYVLGLTRDELNVETLSLHRLAR